MSDDTETPTPPASNTAERDTQPTPRRSPSRRALRPLLLLALLAALTGLLVQRPALRTQAAESARSALVEGLGVSPRQVYAWRLWIAGLDDSALGRRWRSAVARADDDAVNLPRAYQTRGRFAPDAIEARVFHTALARGEQIEVRLSRTDTADDALYASIERRDENNADQADWTPVAELRADGGVTRHIAEREGDYRIVLQPELAADVGFRLATATGGSLAMPVAGANRRDIGSGFGAPRDGGARAHHGVDIFADRGTPVRAVADGRVRTGTEGIGGNHVWLSSGVLGIGGARYYYAHLDEFNVESGDSVDKGDVLGYVGNTGNARTTPPHLHFGIYLAGGPVDPAPFLRPPPDLPSG